MGLTISHGCWHGPYSAFAWWRGEIAKAAGVPLEVVERFCAHDQSIDWSALKPDAVYILLAHSDYEGHILWQECRALANRLQELLLALPAIDDPDLDARPATRKFIRGLRLAATRKQNVIFS